MLRKIGATLISHPTTIRTVPVALAILAFLCIGVGGYGQVGNANPATTTSIADAATGAAATNPTTSQEDSAISVDQSNRRRPHIVTKSWYTDDDGATFFMDVLNKVPPFDHNGKEAVRCFVYKWNGIKFVGYLQKYSDEGKKKLEESWQGNNDRNAKIKLMMEMEREVWIKKPGADNKWINQLQNPNESMKVYTVTAPDGSHTPIEAVPAD